MKHNNKITVAYDPQTCGGERFDYIDQDRAIQAFEHRLGEFLIPAILAWQYFEPDADDVSKHLVNLFLSAEPLNGAWHDRDGTVIGDYEALSRAWAEDTDDGLDFKTATEWAYETSKFYMPTTASLCPTLVLA